MSVNSATHATSHTIGHTRLLYRPHYRRIQLRRRSSITFDDGLVDADATRKSTEASRPLSHPPPSSRRSQTIMASQRRVTDLTANDIDPVIHALVPFVASLDRDDERTAGVVEVIESLFSKLKQGSVRMMAWRLVYFFSWTYF